MNNSDFISVRKKKWGEIQTHTERHRGTERESAANDDEATNNGLVCFSFHFRENEREKDLLYNIGKYKILKRATAMVHLCVYMYRRT